ncbi:RimK family alpha-L-glutamate ligase [Crocinitomicaceae bacterium]|jgi:ribosomal protein S6--L-glutamate ligase|nr:RimK family alpha-L-glutamate ligase [Crocinitomicaceae bacterium]
MKILILATNYKALAVKMMMKSLDKLSVQYDVLNPAQLFLMISNSSNGRNQLFDDYTGKTIKKIDLKQYDIVIPRIGLDVDFSCEVLKYLEEVFKMKTLQSSESISSAYSKIRTSILLRANGLRTPKTMYINKLKNVDIVLNRLSKDQKFVIKLDKGSKGKQVSIVSGIAETKSVLDTIGSMSQQLIIQEYIDSNGTDVRAIVVGDQIVAAYQRKSTGKELRANISTGGEGHRVVLSDEEEEFCVACAKAVGLEFAGVDFIKSKDDTYYCIEVNHCPGMNVQKFSTVNIMSEVVKRAIQKVENPVIEGCSEKEINELKDIANSTFNTPDFVKLFKELKGKTVRSSQTGIQSIIKSKSDLQRLLISQLVIL